MMKKNSDAMGQYNRRDCLEVRGVPVLHGENTNDNIQKLAGFKIGVEIDESDLSVSHRLPVKTTGRNTPKDPTIIVKFVRRDVRERFYRARKELKDLTTRDVGYTRVADKKIFIMEILTQNNIKLLFNSCFRAKRDLNYRFTWTRSGKIFLRLDESSPVLHISGEGDLHKLYETNHRPMPDK